MIVAPDALKFYKVVRLAICLIAREGMLRNEFGRNGMNIYCTARRRGGDVFGSNGMLRNEFGRNGMDVDYTTRRRRAVKTSTECNILRRSISAFARRTGSRRFITCQSQRSAA
jgi:hypothetical protein